MKTQPISAGFSSYVPELTLTSPPRSHVPALRAEIAGSRRRRCEANFVCEAQSSPRYLIGLGVNARTFFLGNLFYLAVRNGMMTRAGEGRGGYEIHRARAFRHCAVHCASRLVSQLGDVPASRALRTCCV